MVSIAPQVVIGVDVGGTNTDAVVVQTDTDTPTVLSSSKTITTSDVTTGVISAIRQTLDRALANHTSGLRITQVNIGTTHFVNAVVQRKNLAKVYVIRLCGPASKKAPPFCDFPKDLEDCINGKVCLVDGGYEFDGKEISPVKEIEILDCIKDAKECQIKNFVVCGLFSPLRSAQEDYVGKLITEHYQEATVTLSNTIGQIGCLERENASILNECLKPLCRETLLGFRNALRNLNLKCPFYLTQNDGTIVSEERALDYPVFTFASGPTNSMRGSAFLSGLNDAIVIDIGGTTTDVGCIRKGFPREASSEVKIGGIRTNFQMPDVLSFGLGGGSYVRFDENGVKVGPLSCGYNLKNESLIFQDKDEKSTTTATDIAVAAGLCELGNPDNVQHLSKSLVSSATVKIREMIETKIDEVKLSSGNVPLILVGGGSVLLDSTLPLKGTSSVIKPEFSDVANAVGAALSQISGTVDYVVSVFEKVDQDKMNLDIETARSLQSVTSSREEIDEIALSVRKRYLENARDVTVSEACSFAIAAAVKAGANPATVNVVEKSDTPLSYLPGNATRVKVKAIGDLQYNKDDVPITSALPDDSYKQPDSKATDVLKKQDVTVTGLPLVQEQKDEKIIKNYEPKIDTDTGEWILSVIDVNCLAVGAGILGCGGGGSPYLGKILATREIEKGKKIRVVTPDKLLKDADPNSDLVVEVGMMGAPLIIQEKLVSGNETVDALKCMQDIHTIGNYTNGNIDQTTGVEVQTEGDIIFIDNYLPNKAEASSSPAGKINNTVGTKNIVGLYSAEIGGLNAIEPLLVSAELDLPTVDCDGMGRAFPELQMFCPFIYDVDPYPATLADEKGRKAVVLKCSTPKQLENHFRRVVVEMGCSAAVTASVLRKHDVINKTINYSVSRAWRLGRAVLLARENSESPIEAITKHEGGKVLIVGKIVDVRRETTGGFNKGNLKVDGIEEYIDKAVLIDFQNENLVARCDGDILACTPDLITVVDSDTGEPISTENVRYGMRVAVLVLPIPDIMCTERALKVVGPKAFGYSDEVSYTKCGQYIEPTPVGPK